MGGSCNSAPAALELHLPSAALEPVLVRPAPVAEGPIKLDSASRYSQAGVQRPSKTAPPSKVLDATDGLSDNWARNPISNRSPLACRSAIANAELQDAI